MSKFAALPVWTLLAGLLPRCTQAGLTEAALVIIDVQDCFLPGGTLAVDEGFKIIPIINNLTAKDCLYDAVIRSQDYHPVGHMSFASTWKKAAYANQPMKCIKPQSGLTKDAACCSTDPNDRDLMPDNPACKDCFESATAGDCFSYNQTLWPDHCEQNGDSGFPKDLKTKESDEVIQKGTNLYVDAYSAFQDNSGFLKTPLESVLNDKGIKKLYVVGIATEYCVYETVLDALELGFEVFVLEDAVAGLSQDGVKDSIAKMRAAGAQVVASTKVLDMPCPLPGPCVVSTTAADPCVSTTAAKPCTEDLQKKFSTPGHPTFSNPGVSAVMFVVFSGLASLSLAFLLFRWRGRHSHGDISISPAFSRLGVMEEAGGMEGGPMQVADGHMSGLLEEQGR